MSSACSAAGAVRGVRGVTHVLLPFSVLARRWDEAGLIGAALGLAAGGWRGQLCGDRSVARPAGGPDPQLGHAAGGPGGQVRAVFTVLVAALDPDPPPVGPAGSPQADAVAAITVPVIPPRPFLTAGLAG